MKALDEDNNMPLLASELIEGLQLMVIKYGDLPVQMAAWMAKDEDENDSASYLWPYSKGGGTVKDGETPAYFYIHGSSITESD